MNIAIGNRAAYYINLDSRTDRLENVQRQISRSRVLTDWKPSRFAAASPSTTAVPSWYCESHGFWASRVSHLALLERGLINDLDYLMVIEDDIELQMPDVSSCIPSFDDSFDYVCNHLPEGWMGVQFGGYHTSPPSQICPGIVRLWRFFECPLALYSKIGMRRIFDTAVAEPNFAFDWTLMELYHKEPFFFAPEILPVSQIHSWSDNENRMNH